MSNILGIKTSDQNIILKLQINQEIVEQKLETGRDMSQKILRFIEEFLNKNDLKWQALDGVVVFRGLGGYPSLRIGVTVANTVVNALKIPIVGTTDEKWFENGIKKLKNYQNDKIVTPIYKNPVIITKPKK